MKNFITRFVVCTVIFLLAACSASKKSVLKQDPALLNTIEKNFADGAAQYRVLMTKLPPDRFPKTYHSSKDQLETSGPGWWCSGFYPGSL
ncbi:MAG TPA: hypothetical protein VGE66_05685, partial [Chitinophagaceae bacterium]